MGDIHSSSEVEKTTIGGPKPPIPGYIYNARLGKWVKPGNSESKDTDTPEYTYDAPNGKWFLNEDYQDYLNFLKGLKSKEVDNIKPDHYNASCSVSCIESMLAVLGEDGTCYFCLGNCFKYLWRYKNKNGEEDIKKAGWYLEYAEELITNFEDTISQSCKNTYQRMDTFYKGVTWKHQEIVEVE